jgi:AraC-like DNA-binding protein
MRPAFERTPRRQWESFHCEVVRGPSYKATWHFHPEYQLTLVLRSRGYRLVGDNLAPLRPGDLVLVGANLPHVWHQEEQRGGSPTAVHAVVVRFLDTFLGPGFLEIPEAQPIRRLLRQARRGLEVTGPVRDAVACEMERLPRLSGLDRVACLLTILSALAKSRDLRPIASPGFVPNVSSGDQSRVERVIDFVHGHLSGRIDRAAVAAAASLSAGAFSRFFKLRTGKTLPQYVNEVRIGRACRLLADEQAKITDVALECGFRSLANFNRRFLEIAGMTPREYRRQLVSCNR